MADRVITAEMVINAKDGGASDVLAKIAGKLDAVAKSAAHSEKIRELGTAFASLDGKMQALDKLKGASKALGAFEERAASTAVRVKTLETAMAATEKPNAAMVMSVTNAHAAFDKASAALARQTEVMRRAEGAVVAMGVPLGKTTEAQERLRREMDATTGAIERQMIADRRAAEASKAGAVADRERIAAQHRLHDIAHRNGVGHLATNAAAAYVSAHGIISVGEKAYEAGAEYQHEVVGLQNAGRTPKEIREITEAAAAATRVVPTSTLTDNLKVISETTSAFGSVEHAVAHLQFIQKASSVLKASGGEHVSGDAGSIGRALAKTFEERMTAPENFEKEANAMIPAMVVSGGTFNPEQLYAFSQQAKTALQNYDIHYLSRIAPSLIGMFGGDRAGTAANAFNSVIMGKVNDKKQAEAWLKAGLLDPSKVTMKAGHAVGWTAGAVKNTNLALRDPLAWAEQVELPAMRDKMHVNMSDRLSVAKALGTMYRNTNANLWATEHLQEASRHRLHKDADLADKVGTTDDIYGRNMHNDPTVAMTGLTSAFENLMTAVTADGMKPAAEGITWVAGALGHLAEVAKEHPTGALVTGGAALAGGLGVSGFLTARLLGGFGLPGAATHLEASALALKEVAGVLATEGHGTLGAPGTSVEPGKPGTPGAAENGPKGFLGKGGVKGIGSIIAEGVIGAIIYDYGVKAMDSVLGWTADNQKTLDHATSLGNVYKDVKEQWFKGAPNDPAAADRDARLRRTERQRLMRDPLESGLDRLRAEMTGENAPLPAERPSIPLPPARPPSVFSGLGMDGNALRRWDEMLAGQRAVSLPAIVPPPEPATASAFHPDDDRITRSRASDAASWLDELGRRERESVFTLGALNDKTGVLQASFSTLDTGTGSAAQQIALLGLAARTVAGAMAGMLANGSGGSGGGSGIISAAYHPGGDGFGNGAPAMTPLLRGAQPHGGGTQHASLGGGGPNPYADAPGGATFVPPVGDHLTAGMRNNNLGNIGWFGQHTPGLLGPSNARDVDHSIGKFATQEDGIRAAASLALAKYHKGRRSTWDIIAAAGGWTPGALGPGASVNVARAMGLGNRDDVHLDDPGQMVKFLHGLAVQEHGPAGRFYSEDRIRGALGHKEHPALSGPPLRPREPAAPESPAHVSTARLEEKMERMTAAVERGGLVRHELSLPKGMQAKRTYQRGSVGSTIA